MAEGKSESAEGQPKRAAEDESQGTKLTKELAEAALGGKAEPEPEPEKKAEEQPEYKPRTEAERVPWDKKRQARDQTQANVMKELKALRAEMRELRQMRTAGESSGRSVDDILKDLDDLEESNDEFATDEEQREYRKKSARLRKELKAATSALQKGAEKVEKTDAVAEEKEAEVEKEPSGASQEDFYETLDEADKQFGGKFRRDAVKRILSIFEKRGYSAGKSPTKEVIEDIVVRVYAEMAREDALEQAKKSAERRPEDIRPKAATTGLAQGATAGGPQRERMTRKAWVEKERRERAAKGRR